MSVDNERPSVDIGRLSVDVPQDVEQGFRKRNKEISSRAKVVLEELYNKDSKSDFMKHRKQRGEKTETK